ncbi:acyltransferase family protein [Alphaproteobacteria bacterium]|nr:acyltransferase family protein [Alphaproteobacteria bacterium]
MKSINNIILKKRILWIDIARAIGIQVVLIGHISNSFQPFIFSWHMPFFFIISGLVININSKLKSTIIRDFRNLILPFIIFSFVALIIELPKREILNREPLNYLEQIKNIIIWWDYESLTGTYAFVLWFLPALFFAKFFIIVLLKFLPLRNLHLVVLVLYFTIGYNFDLPLSLDEALIATPFVYMGHIIINLYTKENFIDKIKMSVFVISIFSIYCYLQFGVPGLDLAIKKFQPLFYSMFWSVLISIIILALCYFMSGLYRFLLPFINGAMTFYIMHPYTHNIADQLRQLVEINSWVFTYLVSLGFLFSLHFIFHQVRIAIFNEAKT